MNQKVELTNMEIHEFCLLDRDSGEIEYYDEKKVIAFTGLYFKNDITFFAIYPTLNGPMIFYMEKEYPINKSLSIVLQKEEKKRSFIIKDYNMNINYTESPFIGFDNWSDEIDVDLFYMIEQSYRNDDFYKQYTLI